MYTPEDIEKIVLDYLNPDLSEFITGNVTHKDERVSGSDEDVTISILSLIDGDPQTAFVNVTIHLKDIGVRNTGTQKIDYKPNKPRFDAIKKKIDTLLNGNAGKYWKYGNLFISGYSPNYADTPTLEHFSTITVKVNAHQKVYDQVE